MDLSHLFFILGMTKNILPHWGVIHMDYYYYLMEEVVHEILLH